MFGGRWDPGTRHKLLKECEQRARVCVLMYKYQMQREVWELMSEAGVDFVEVDQCEAGAVLSSMEDDEKEEPIQKHSGFLTNSEEIMKSLSVFKCRNRDEKDPRGKHEHGPQIGGKRSQMAEFYPPRLVESTLEGLTKQLEADGMKGEGAWTLYVMEIGVHIDEDAVDFDEPTPDPEVFFDNISGPRWILRRSRQKGGRR